MRPSDWSAVDYSTDPVPGNPTIVLNGGNDYIEVADAIADAAAAIAVITKNEMTSKAVDALQENGEKVSADIVKAEARYRETGLALIAYAPVLESAQTESASALTDAQGAKDNESTSQYYATYYLQLSEDSTDPAEKQEYKTLADQYDDDVTAARGAVTSARSRIETAMSDRDKAANTAIDRITDITGSDDLNDGWWENWGADVLAAITDIAGWVSTIAGILALCVSWIPVIGQIAAAALLLIAGIAALVNAIGNIVLAMTGERSWLDAIVSIVGALLSVVGLGGAAKLVGLAMKSSKITMKVGQQLTVKQALKLKPDDWAQWNQLRNADIPTPQNGQIVYRTYGGGSGPTGGSWTPTNPANLPNPRANMGLPDANDMNRVVTARLDDVSSVVNTRHALPYDGNLGGAAEYIIPGSMQPGGITVLSDLPFVVP